MSRIVWHSVPPWTPTAYGTQTALVVGSLLDAGYDVVCSADSGLHDGPVPWRGTSVHPSPIQAPGSLATWLDGPLAPGPDGVVITLGDASRLAREPLDGRRVLSWIPVQADPLDEVTAAHLHRSGSTAVAISEFGRRSLVRAGFPEPPLVPHGIDLDAFRPLVLGDREESRRQARRQVGLDEAAFVVGVVAANVQPEANRKCLPEILVAVDRLARRHDDVTVYLHTDLHGTWHGGADLRPLLAASIGERVPVVVTGDVPLRTGLPSSSMGVLYNAFDVLCAPSAAEGFCLPLVEAQACGIPVVASDHAAQPENVGVGWLVEGQPRWHPPDGSHWFEPSIEAITDALDQAWHERGARWEAAVAFGATYDHDQIFDRCWRPLLTSCGVEPTDRGRTAPPA